MSIIDEYFQKIIKQYELGNATEHTYRATLSTLIENISDNVIITNEPKGNNGNRPDISLINKKNKSITIGYIETKDIHTNLEKIENTNDNTDQIERYKESLDNFILTNYLDFVFFRNKQKTYSISIAKLENGKIHSLQNQFDIFKNTIQDFCRFQGETIKTADQLADIMAEKAQLMRATVYNILKDELHSNTLHEYLKAFQKMLLNNMSKEQFSDIYAQTIVYGLLAAKIHNTNNNNFSAEKTPYLIPASNPFLQDFFHDLYSPSTPNDIKRILNELTEIFSITNLEFILSKNDFGNPIIHFYETFLNKYDPSLRKQRGVYYTPDSIVSFIVEAVDEILKTEFEINDGLSNTDKVKLNKQDIHKVQILDPATGTGTFLIETLKYISKNFIEQKGVWNNYVEDHLKPRLHGFEVLMASYAMCHLQLDLEYSKIFKDVFKSTKSTQKRFGVYLANALEEVYGIEDTTGIYHWLVKEAEGAKKIKQEHPIMCILGNPPYSGESANKGFILSQQEDLLNDYKKEPGGKEKLQERNSKWLNNDYVKFIRLGQHFIEKNGSGIVAFITSNSFLDAPIFRGMRWNLLKTYDKIYILNLHGNSKKKETNIDGSKDENVFKITEGVSINIFIKTGTKKETTLGKLYYYDLLGTKEFKYNFLQKTKFKKVPYQKLTPNADTLYEMAPNNCVKDVRDEYLQGFKITDLFTTHSVGIVTARDQFTIHQKQTILQQKIIEFSKMDIENSRTKFKLGKDVRDWKVHLAKADILNHFQNTGNETIKILYRPFDKRYTYYTGTTKGFHCMPRSNVMQHFLKGNNIGLIFKRGNQEKKSASIHITKSIIDFRSWSRPGMNGGDYVAPLYLYKDTIDNEEEQKIPNLNTEIIDKMAKILQIPFVDKDIDIKKKKKDKFTPLDVVDYIYAVLYSSSYRTKYNDCLVRDFPSIPYPSDINEFWNFVKAGTKLRELHLMENISTKNIKTTFNQSGSNVVEKIIWKENKVYINKEQYFDNISEIAWNFYIGGYQPAQKWLDDRIETKLDFDDILHYQQLITALTETDIVIKEIDAIKIF